MAAVNLIPSPNRAANVLRALLLNAVAGAGADLIANADRSLPTIADLRGFPKPALVAGRTLVVSVMEYAALADRGGGQFRWQATSSQADDGGRVINPTGNVGAGRWIRIGDSVSVDQYGAGLGSDDAARFQAAHDFVSARPGGGVVNATAGAVYIINSGLTWDTNRVGFNGHGCQINNQAQTSGVFLTIAQSETDANKRPALNRLHPWENVVVTGVDQAAGTTLALLLNDASASKNVAGVTFKNGAFLGYKVSVRFQDGAFFNTFKDWEFASVVGANVGTVLQMPAATNGGEKNNFINCRFAAAAGLILDQANGNASTFFVSCAFNYSSSRMITVSGGSVFATHCTMESSGDTDYWVGVTGLNSFFSADNLSLVCGSAKANFPFFYSDASATQGGVILNSINFQSISAYPLPLVGGTGRVRARNISHYGIGTHFYVGAGANLLAYGGFESANFASEVTLSGATLPVRSAINPKTGANALRFAGISGQNNAARWSVRCDPGQYFSGRIWTAVTGYGTGGSFYATIAYVDKGGNVLSSSVVANFTGNSAYTETRFNSATMAPPGTASAVLDVSFFGVTTGTPFGDLDDVILNVS